MRTNLFQVGITQDCDVEGVAPPRVILLAYANRVAEPADQAEPPVGQQKANSQIQHAEGVGERDWDIEHPPAEHLSVVAVSARGRRRRKKK